MQTNTTSKPAQSSLSVPLARDEQGNSIVVPAEAAFWRVRRQTRGRPRNIAGLDRGPLKLPLDFTEDDLHNMLGDGSYRLDLCNQAGDSLDLAVTVAVGELEPINANEPMGAAEPVGSLLPATASDVRLVLEANIRATQMAFQHNERTLAASLRMADTLSDGIRDLATAQASWITSISSARGFFRNAPPLQLPAPERISGEDDDREEDEDDDDVEAPASGFDWVTTLQPIVGMVTKQAVTAIMGVITKSGGGGSDLLANALDWRRAAAKRDEPKPPVAQISPPTDESTRQADPKGIPDMLVEKAIAISAFLAPAEQSRLMGLMPLLMKRANDPDLLKLVSELVPLSPADGAIWVQSHVDEIEQRFAS